jgi:hypothetical protein
MADHQTTYTMRPRIVALDTDFDEMPCLQFHRQIYTLTKGQLKTQESSFCHVTWEQVVASAEEDSNNSDICPVQDLKDSVIVVNR